MSDALGEAETEVRAWRVNPYWAEIEHCHNFSYRRLRALLTEHGFEPVSCSVSNRYRVCMDVVARKGEPVHQA